MTSKKLLSFTILTLLFISGCCPGTCKAPDKDTAVKINNYTISRDEFDQEFKASAYGKVDTPDTRQQFLNALIDRKLILQYAQKEELDKKKGFLRMIEKFWEQSLLKTALDKKTREIMGTAPVTDYEIRATYDNMIKENKTDESYESAYMRIKWDLVRAKENKMMNDWIADMHKTARISVNKDILKEKK